MTKQRKNEFLRERHVYVPFKTADKPAGHFAIVFTLCLCDFGTLCLSFNIDKHPQKCFFIDAFQVRNNFIKNK